MVYLWGFAENCYLKGKMNLVLVTTSVRDPQGLRELAAYSKDRRIVDTDAAFSQELFSRKNLSRIARRMTNLHVALQRLDIEAVKAFVRVS
jgi:hypothetical protein